MQEAMLDLAKEHHNVKFYKVYQCMRNEVVIYC
jgi:hypothetical protein